MNDLEQDVSTGSMMSKFADDTKLCHPNDDDDDDIDEMQDINKLHAWSAHAWSAHEQWQMSFNKDKCGVMYIGHNISHHSYIFNTKGDITL